jgi:hypothetical protein
VKGVALDAQRRVLLLKNERDEWELPGGRLETGSSGGAVPADDGSESALEREIQGETGWEVKAGSLIDGGVWIYEPIPVRRVLAAEEAVFDSCATHTRLSALMKEIQSRGAGRRIGRPLGQGGSRPAGHGVRRVAHALIGPGGGGRDNAVSDLPAGAEALTGHIGRGVHGLTVTGGVRKQRPAVVGRGRRRGRQQVDPPVVDRLVVPRGLGHEPLLRVVDKKVTDSRPGSLQEGLEQGEQEAADSWLLTGRVKGRTLTLPQEVKIWNTVYRSRQSTAGRPDAVGV